MGLSGGERKALAWLLLRNPSERKRLAVSTVRCRRGCVLGTVFGFEGSLWLWTVYDLGSEADTLAFYRLGESMREARTAPQPRAEDLAALTAPEYMTAFRAGAFNLSDLAEISDGKRMATVAPLATAHAAEVRCAHIETVFDATAIDLAKRTHIVN